MYGTLELEQDLAFQDRMRRLQRAGRSVMGLLVLLGLLGAFGAGPLSRAKARNATRTWTAQYDRFPRRGAETELTFTFPAGAMTDPIRLKLDKKYVEKLRYVRAVPEPLSMETGADGLTLVFDVEDPQKESRAVIVLNAEGYGPAKNEGIRQFIYP